MNIFKKITIMTSFLLGGSVALVEADKIKDESVIDIDLNTANYLDELMEYIDYEGYDDAIAAGAVVDKIDHRNITAKEQYSYSETENCIQILLGGVWYDIDQNGIIGIGEELHWNSPISFRVFNHSISKESWPTINYPTSTSSDNNYNQQYEDLKTTPGYTVNASTRTRSRFMHYNNALRYNDTFYDSEWLSEADTSNHGNYFDEDVSIRMDFNHCTDRTSTSLDYSSDKLTASTGSYECYGGAGATIRNVDVELLINGIEVDQTTYTAGSSGTGTKINYWGQYSYYLKITSSGQAWNYSRITAEAYIISNMVIHTFTSRTEYYYSVSAHGIIDTLGNYTTIDDIIAFTFNEDLIFELGDLWIDQRHYWDSYFSSQLMHILGSEEYFSTNAIYDLYEPEVGEISYIFTIYDRAGNRTSILKEFTVVDTRAFEGSIINVTDSNSIDGQPNYESEWSLVFNMINDRYHYNDHTLLFNYSYDNVSWLQKEYLISTAIPDLVNFIPDEYKLTKSNDLWFYISDENGNITNSFTNSDVNLTYEGVGVYHHKYYYESSYINIDAKLPANIIDSGIEYEAHEGARNTTWITDQPITVFIDDQDYWTNINGIMVNGQSTFDPDVILSREGVNTISTMSRAGVWSYFEIIIDTTSPTFNYSNPENDSVNKSTRTGHDVYSNLFGMTVSWDGSNIAFNNDIASIYQFIGYGNESYKHEVTINEALLLSPGWHGFIVTDMIGNTNTSYFYVEGNDEKYISIEGANNNGNNYIAVGESIISWDINSFTSIKIDGKSINQNFSIDQDGIYSIVATSWSGKEHSYTLEIDKASPDVSIKSSGTIYAGNYSKESVIINYSNTEIFTIEKDGVRINDFSSGDTLTDTGNYHIRALNSSSKVIDTWLYIRLEGIIISNELNDNYATSDDSFTISNIDDWVEYIIYDSEQNPYSIDHIFDNETIYTFNGIDKAFNEVAEELIIDWTKPELLITNLKEQEDNYAEWLSFNTSDTNFLKATILLNKTKEIDYDLNTMFDTLGEHEVIIYDKALNEVRFEFNIVSDSEAYFWAKRGITDNGLPLIIFGGIGTIALAFALTILWRKRDLYS